MIFKFPQFFSEKKSDLKQNKTKKMEVNLKMDDATARRLYPTAAPEFKEMLEQNFGKEFFNKKFRDRIRNYKDICDELGVSDNDDTIKIEVPAFTSDEIKVVKAFIKKMRISKVYRKGVLPKRGDRRYYYWHELIGSSPSGLRFSNTSSYGDRVSAGSAAHLSLLEEDDAKDVATKFMDIDADFYALPKV